MSDKTCPEERKPTDLACTFCICGRVDEATLAMRREALRRQRLIEAATDGLDYDEHGYVI